MSKRIDIIENKIEKIEQIVKKAGNITNALSDDTIYKPAILMHLVAIAEQFQKIQNDLDLETLSKFDKEDIRGAIAVRNFIAHDYEGINIALIENIIREYLPKLKKTIKSIKS